MPHAALIRTVEDGRMDTTRRPRDDLLDVLRVLLLLQGSILVVATVEAAIFGAAFGNGGASVLLSAAAATAILVARARMRADRRWPRRLVYIVEGITLVTLAIDTVLALAITRALPPALALLTRLVLPVVVVALLGRSTQAGAGLTSGGPRGAELPGGLA